MSGPDSTGTADEPPEPGALVLTIVLVGLAGWVDAVGFVHWHGLFVSFMSGNTTRTAAAIGTDWGTVAASGTAIAVFVAGVVLGETIGARAGAWRRPAVLATEAALLWAGLSASLADAGELATASALGLAMGVQNAGMHGAGASVTFVTGTLVRIGRGLADALRGAKPFRAMLPHLGIWLGLFGGAILGAVIARVSEPVAIAAVAALVTAIALLTGAAARRPESTRD